MFDINTDYSNLTIRAHRQVYSCQTTICMNRLCYWGCDKQPAAVQLTKCIAGMSGTSVDIRAGRGEPGASRPVIAPLMAVLFTDNGHHHYWSSSPHWINAVMPLAALSYRSVFLFYMAMCLTAMCLRLQTILPCDHCPWLPCHQCPILRCALDPCPWMLYASE